MRDANPCFYYPRAVYRRENGTEGNLWSYTSTDTWEKAQDVIHEWAENHHLLSAEIGVQDILGIEDVHRVF